MNDSPNSSPTSSLLSLITLEGLIAIILCALACLLGSFAFWRLAAGSGDTLTVTDYVTEIAPQQRQTFGYGGVTQTSDQSGTYQNANVPFQSRAMSSFSFTISNHDNLYWIEGEEDRLQVNGRQVESHNPVKLSEGTTFKSIGRYGSASFTAHLNEDSNRIRLELRSPVYYQLKSNKTRLSFGLFNDVVNSPIDEILVRSVLRQRPSDNFLLEKKKDGGFSLSMEEDLARPPSTESEILSGITKSNQPGTAVSLNSEDSFRAGTTIVRLSGNAGAHLFGDSSAAIFGLKLILIVLMLAIAFGIQGFGMHDTQIRMPYGPVIFGSVVVFGVVGVALTARDYLLPPHNQERLPEYLKWFFISVVILYFIRIPVKSFHELRWARMLPLFLFTYILLNRPLEGLLTIPPIFRLVLFVILFFAGAFIVHWLMRGVYAFVELAANADWLRVLLIVILPLVIIMIITIIAGGRSALTVLGSRIHLPTLFTTFLVLGTVIGVTAAEAKSTEGWLRDRTIVLGSILLTVGLYYILSNRDHGGTAILAIGVFASMWAAARKNRPWIFTILLGIGFVVVVYLAIVFQQQRVDIAMGGTEGAQRYFDEWVNLRTARDMARAGGVRGLYDGLYIPSSVSMNIYNDLVAAYVAGFFGLIGLGVMTLAYYLFYTRLLAGIFALGNDKRKDVTKQGQAEVSPDARPEMPSPFVASVGAPDTQGPNDKATVRHVFEAFAIGLIAIFLFQFVWMFTATFWSKIPFSGLDLQPISASRISILAFIVSLLGSISWIHNVYPRIDESRS